MMSTLRRYATDAVRAFDRAAVEVALAFCAAVMLSWSVEVHAAEAAVAHVAAAIVITALCAWGATIMHALGGIDRRTRWLMTVGAALFAAAYLLLTSDMSHDAEGWRAFMLVGAAALLALAAPALPRLADAPNLRLRRVNARLFLRSAGIELYGLALFAGLSLALLSIDNLFELKLEDEIYAHVYIWIMAVLVPWVIVGGIDDYVRPLDEQSDVARVTHRLVTYLVPLLVALYFIILYVYALRIAVTGELPRNLVSPMVIAAGLLSMFALILFEPASESPGGTRWLRWTPILYIPLAPLGLWALFARTDDYGFTEFRLLRLVALVAVLVLAIIMSINLWRRRPFALRVIPMLLAASLLVAAIGPWSILALSKRDQQQRLSAALREAHIDASIRPAHADSTKRSLPFALYQRITNGAAYLQSHYGPAAITAAVPTFEPIGEERFDAATYFGLAPIYNDTARHTFFARLAVGEPLQLTHGVAYRIEIPAGSSVQPFSRITGDSILVIVAGDSLRADLSAVVAAASTAEGPSRREPVAVTSVPLFDGARARRGDLLLLDVSVVQEKGKSRVSHLDALIVIGL